MKKRKGQIDRQARQDDARMGTERSQGNDNEQKEEKKVAAVMKGLNDSRACFAEFPARAKLPRHGHIKQLHTNHQDSQRDILPLLQRVMVFHGYDVPLFPVSGQRRPRIICRQASASGAFLHRWHAVPIFWQSGTAGLPALMERSKFAAE